MIDFDEFAEEIDSYFLDTEHEQVFQNTHSWEHAVFLLARGGEMPMRYTIVKVLALAFVFGALSGCASGFQFRFEAPREPGMNFTSGDSGARRVAPREKGSQACTHNVTLYCPDGQRCTCEAGSPLEEAARDLLTPR